MQYELIRSNRKTIAIQVRDGKVLVRAPLRAKMKDIQAFVDNNTAWIEKHLAKSTEKKNNQKPVNKLTSEELQKLADQALEVIPERVKYFAPIVGVTYGKITIRNQRTRWGSCSSKGNLNFNCLLMLTPMEVIDSVVVHELCHRLEMNHSKRFYAEVLRVYPEYYKYHKWLKEHGSELMARME